MEAAAAPVTEPTRLVPTHQRKILRSAEAEAVPFFDENRVPIETIEVPNPEIAGLTPEQYTVIGSKETYRLAQQPGSYVVIKYIRPVSKRLDTQAISCPSAPVGVLEGSRADVSFVAGVTVDKFLYHLPLYRIHQRLQDMGFTLSRVWLTQLMQQIARLLRLCKPLHNRKAWLFCWTELGAKQVGIVQSLLTTCRLHDINPYDYLVDVMQRVSQHPSARVVELTPRLWKQHFAANPLRSDLYNISR